MSRGRYQLGQEIPLSVLTVDGSGTPTAPTAAPYMDIYKGETQIHSGLAMPSLDAGAVVGLFQRNVFLGVTFSVGRFIVVYHYTVGSYEGQVSEEFEIVTGGSASGHVIAAHWYERPHAGFIVQQLDSGKLVKGRNPTV